MKRYPGISLLAFSGLLLGLSAFADESRYIVSEPVSGEQIVFDSVTNLIWQKSYVSGETWQMALAYCESLTYSGETDWRLPNKKELMSLVNYESYHPASSFPDMPSEYFWSSSSNSSITILAWRIGFGDGTVGYYDKGNSLNARCVRSGP